MSAINDMTGLVLGRQVDHSRFYDPSQLCPVPRSLGRTAAGMTAPLSFTGGVDIWNAYELSWLTPSGLPAVAMAEIRVPWDSPHLIESKSLKLYCNSFNMSVFENADIVARAMMRDLSAAAGADVHVGLISPGAFAAQELHEPAGICMDDLDVTCSAYGGPHPELLETSFGQVEEVLYTRLFRSCCPVTGQPDWATVRIAYSGTRIRPSALLAYLVSYREHQGFHEACVERIHSDIMTVCAPARLRVGARFTRRGGLDINPVRDTHPARWGNQRDPRQ